MVLERRSHAGPEYLLLALLREEGIAELLRPRGVTFEGVRTAIDARQQKPFVLTVIDSPAPDLSFVRYDPAIHQEFAGMLAELPLRGAADHAAILTNLAAQPVTAMVARWTVIDPAGGSRVRDVTRDDYEPRRPNQSLEPGGRRLVTMTGFHPAFDVSRPHGWVSAGRERLEDDAAEIRVSLDSAVFADGRLVGPDEYGIGDHLHGRYATAKDLVEQVDRAVAASEDVEALLTSLTSGAQKPSRWRWILAAQGSSAIRGGPTGNQRYESWLDSLRTVPKPPQLFR